MFASIVMESADSSTSQQRVKWDELFTRLESLYAAGDVKRCHTVQTLRTYTIAEHVYGSMVIARELIALNHAQAALAGLSISAKDVFEALLVHDAPEYETGDIPAPVKRADEIGKVFERLETEYYARHSIRLPQLNQIERDIVRASDTLDLGMFIVREHRLGNRNRLLETIINNVFEYIQPQRYLVGVDELHTYLRRAFYFSI